MSAPVASPALSEDSVEMASPTKSPAVVATAAESSSGLLGAGLARHNAKRVSASVLAFQLDSRMQLTRADPECGLMRMRQCVGVAFAFAGSMPTME